MIRRPPLRLLPYLLPWILFWSACAPAPSEAPSPDRTVRDLLPHFTEAPSQFADPEKAKNLTEQQTRPTIRDKTKAVFLPIGVRLDIPLLLPPGSSLKLGRLSLRKQARLDLSLRTDAHGTVPVASFERSGEDLLIDFDLTTDKTEPTPALLIVRSRGKSRDSGVLMERPELLSNAPSPPTDLRPDDLPRPTRPPIVLYVIDTLRRDRLGCYGYPRPTSPHLDAFAEGATLFERAVGQSSWTMASMASAFTGTWPATHGVLSWQHRLAPEALTLAEILQTEGYRTAAFVANPLVGKGYGFQQGFDEIVDQVGISSSDLGDRVNQWLPDSSKPPFFLWIQTMDPHAPYDPPEPYRDRLAPDTEAMPPLDPERWDWPEEAKPFLSDLYDAEIAANDASFGALRAELEARDLWDPALVILMSDHGEEFKEHGRWQHGNQLYTESLDIPFIVKFPHQRQGRRIAEPVQHTDLLPSLLDLLEIRLEEPLDGRSWLSPSPHMPIYAHLDLDESPPIHGLVLGDWKMVRILRPEDGIKNRLFYLPDDPGEKHNVASKNPIRVTVFEALLDAKLARSKARGSVAQEIPADPQTRQALEALGYLQD